MTFMNGDAGISTMLHQRMIELRPWCNGSKDSTNIWQRKFNCSSSWGVHNNVRAHLPVGNSGRVKAKLVKDSQRVGGEPVATTLVTGECGLIHHCHIVAKAMKGGGTCGS
jgi:hypothetical protein